MEMKELSLSDRLQLLNHAPKIEAPSTRTDAAPQSKSFGDFLSEQVKQANDLNVQAEDQMKQMLSGDGGNPHGAYIAIQKADISFRLLMTVKERLVEAYQTVLRTSVG